MGVPEVCPRCDHHVSSPADPAVYPDLPADKIIDRILSGRGRPAPFLYDREVARFLVAGIDTRPENVLLSDRLERFGKTRSPRYSTLNRLALRVRAVRREASGIGPIAGVDRER